MSSKIITPVFVKGVLISAIAISISGCLTGRKVDRFVARQYGNRLPVELKKKDSSIIVQSRIVNNSKEISSTVARTSNMLPLLFYWQYDYKNTCTINPAIPIHYFTSTIRAESAKLKRLLNGNHLELSVEQLPNVFAIDDKSHMIWLILYAYGWDKVSIQPEHTDLVVSYQVLDKDTRIKSGKIVIPDTERDRRIHMFQSWKSATGNYLAGYNHDITVMTRSFVDQLVKEL